MKISSFRPGLSLPAAQALLHMSIFRRMERINHWPMVYLLSFMSAIRPDLFLTSSKQSGFFSVFPGLDDQVCNENYSKTQ
jgi:hypothetical protein